MSTLREHMRQHPSCQQALADWRAMVRAARWDSPVAMMAACGRSARPISADRVVFEISGNRFRLVAAVRWAVGDEPGVVYIKFFGTHAEYDRIDALTVDQLR